MLKRKSINSKITTVIVTCFILVMSLSMFSFAANSDVTAVPAKNVVQNTNLEEPKPINLMSSYKPMPSIQLAAMGLLSVASSPYVAVLTLFSDGTVDSSDGSSGLTAVAGKHSFVTIKNISPSTLLIGGLANIATNKTVSIGTWGNKSEHKGAWYNLESMYVNKYNAYQGRVSISWAITSVELGNANTFIKNNDFWSTTAPCSTFAQCLWNNVLKPYPNYLITPTYGQTPKLLATAIKSMPLLAYQTKASVPYDYSVFYAQGSGAPKRSTKY